MPPTTTNSTPPLTSSFRISPARSGHSGADTGIPRAPARQRQLGGELVEDDSVREACLGRHLAVAEKVPGVVTARHGARAQNRLPPHGEHQRAQPGPGDLLVPALDASDRALARAGAEGEAALAEALALTGRADEFGGRHDAVYGINSISSNSTSPLSTRAMPLACAGARRRSVGLPGLKIWKPSEARSCRGMWEWPK